MMRSFRARLTLWNVVVIALVLGAFSGGMIYANQARLAADIDRELADRARGSSPQPPPGPRGGGMPPPGGRFGMEQGGPQRPGDAPPPRFSDPAAIRFADVRRPRRFDRTGEPMGPMQDAAFDKGALMKALQGEATYADGEFDGEPIRIFTLAMRDRGEVIGAVQVARQVRDIRNIWAAQLGTLAIFLPGALLAAAVGAFFLTGRAIKPIAEMKSAASAITESDLTQRLAIRGSDEFAELGTTFNAMVERLETAFKNLQSAYDQLHESHELQKRFTADASHELRTPLTRMRLATSSALEASATEEDRRKALEIADDAAQSMARLVQEMLVLARADAGQLGLRREAVDLRALAADAMDQFTQVRHASHDPKRVELAADMETSPVVAEVDAAQIHRVLANLLENAVRHSIEGGKVTMSVGRDNESAILRVGDTGEGIAAEHLPRLGERFYRVDPSRSRQDGGSGLGLAICLTIVEAHGGTMKIESALGNGTSVTIRLPLPEGSRKKSDSK